MKTLFQMAAALAAFAVVTQASAADLPLPDKAPPAPAAGYWSGFYIGLNGGGAFGHADSTGNDALGGVPTASFTGSYSVNGGFAGGQFGVQYQFPSNIVLGFEANIDGSDIHGSTAFCTVGNCQTNSYELWSFSTLDGRLGYAVGNVLFYGTGGGVAGNIRTHSTLTSFPKDTALVGLVTGDTEEPMGWTAGAGIEWGFMPNWTLKVEYKHLAFVNDNLQAYNYGLVAGTTPFVGQAIPKAGIDTVRIGVNYLFHWGDNTTPLRY